LRVVVEGPAVALPLHLLAILALTEAGQKPKSPKDKASKIKALRDTRPATRESRDFQHHTKTKSKINSLLSNTLHKEYGVGGHRNSKRKGPESPARLLKKNRSYSL
jgi:hypothetical protein